MWVHLLATKDQASAAIKKLQAAVELESGQKLKMLHMDRGGEFTSKELGEYFSDQGVQWQPMVLYTPRQNGVVERRN
jgi:transposase InsO family protein